MGQRDFLKRKTDRKAAGAESETLVVHRHEHGRIPGDRAVDSGDLCADFPGCTGQYLGRRFRFAGYVVYGDGAEPDVAATGNAQRDGAGQTAVGRHETYFGAAGI